MDRSLSVGRNGPVDQKARSVDVQSMIASGRSVEQRVDVPVFVKGSHGATLAADDVDMTPKLRPTVELRCLANGSAHNHPIHPTVPHRDPASVAWCLRGGAGGGPNRATAIVMTRLVFTMSGASGAFTALRLVDVVTAVHSHLNELAMIEYGLQQLARLEAELPTLLTHPYRHRRAGECHCRRNAVGRGAAAAYRNADRADDWLSQA
jgi:hypothetical protein